MKADDRRLVFIYYLITYFLCLLAAISVFPMLEQWQSLVFFAVAGIGLFFSARTEYNLKRKIRSVAGFILGIVLVVFLIKFSPQWSILPHLMRLFLIVIALNCFTVDDDHRMCLVHFGSIFFIIFSTCLPLVIHPRIQALVLSGTLFLSVFLLQITHISASAVSDKRQYVVTNVNLMRRFIMSVLFTVIIIIIGLPLFYIVPKVSIKLNFDRAGSSVVDFKTFPEAQLRLKVADKGGGMEIDDEQVVPFIRSLFSAEDKGIDSKVKDEDKWKQPLVIKKKGFMDKIHIKERKVSKDLSRPGDGLGYSQEPEKTSGGISSIDERLKKEKDSFLKQRRILQKKISQNKKLVKFLDHLGKDDPIYKEKKENALKNLNRNKQKLAALDNKISKITKKLENEQARRQAAELTGTKSKVKEADILDEQDSLSELNDQDQELVRETEMLLALSKLKNVGQALSAGGDAGSSSERATTAGFGSGLGKSLGKSSFGVLDGKGKLTGYGSFGTEGIGIEGQEGKGEGEEGGERTVSRGFAKEQLKDEVVGEGKGLGKGWSKEFREGLDIKESVDTKRAEIGKGIGKETELVGEEIEGTGEGAGEGIGEEGKGAGEGTGEGIGEEGEGAGEGAGEGIGEEGKGTGEGTGEGIGEEIEGTGEGTGEGIGEEGEGTSEGAGEGIEEEGKGTSEGAGEGIGEEGEGAGEGTGEGTRSREDSGRGLEGQAGRGDGEGIGEQGDVAGGSGLDSGAGSSGDSGGGASEGGSGGDSGADSGKGSDEGSGAGPGGGSGDGSSEGSGSGAGGGAGEGSGADSSGDEKGSGGEDTTEGAGAGSGEGTGGDSDVESSEGEGEGGGGSANGSGEGAGSGFEAGSGGSGAADSGKGTAAGGELGESGSGGSESGSVSESDEEESSGDSRTRSRDDSGEQLLAKLKPESKEQTIDKFDKEISREDEKQKYDSDTQQAPEGKFKDNWQGLKSTFTSLFKKEDASEQKIQDLDKKKTKDSFEKKTKKKQTKQILEELPRKQEQAAILKDKKKRWFLFLTAIAILFLCFILIRYIINVRVQYLSQPVPKKFIIWAYQNTILELKKIREESNNWMIPLKPIEDIRMRYLFRKDPVLFVVCVYENLVFIFRKLDKGLKSFITPKEIIYYLTDDLEAYKEDFSTLTEIFQEARYSNHEISKEDVLRCANIYNKIKNEILKKETGFRKIWLKLNMFSLKLK